MEVEIEAVTGKLDEEPEEEIYQIGEEKLFSPRQQKGTPNRVPFYLSGVGTAGLAGGGGSVPPSITW